MKKKLALIVAILVLITGLVFAQKTIDNQNKAGHSHSGGCCPGH